MKRTESVTAVGKRLQGRNRTKLYDWFWTHWDELPEYQPYRVNWPGMVQDLNELGLRGRDENEPLSIGTVRKTFFRVKADKEAEGRHKPSSVVRRPPALPLPTAPAKPVHRTDPPPSDDDDGGYDFDKTIKREP
jgi:hypothetical protein